jgi:hypothetical protein
VEGKDLPVVRSMYINIYMVFEILKLEFQSPNLAS